MTTIQTTPGVAQDLAGCSEAALLEGIDRVVGQQHERRRSGWRPDADRKAEAAELDAELERWWQALRLLRSHGKRTPGVIRRQDR